MAFEFATQKDDVRAIDEKIEGTGKKNKWRWDWLEDEHMQQYIRKVKLPGIAFCTLCNQQLKYKSSGKKDLLSHVKNPKHTTKMTAVKTSQSLAGMILQSKSTTINASESNAPTVRPLVPVADRRFNLEAMLLGFIAENDLPYTLAPQLVQLSQVLAKDPKALNEMKLERTTASYKMSEGVSKLFRNEISDELKDKLFCLNLDESTNVREEKIVAVLISYFDQKANQITVRHLESFKVVKADAASIYYRLEGVLEKFGLLWDNLISILLDSCNTMRGKKSGLETRIREKAPNLLDIDGDTVHHVHNATKAFTSPFHYYLEGLFNTLHSDFHWSIDFREELELLCTMLNIKFTVPERFMNHRFLSAYNVAVDSARLLDAYTVFYFAFLTPTEQEKHQGVIDKIMHNRGVSEKSYTEILAMKTRLRKKKMTKEGKDRKQEAMLKIFDERKKTRMLLGIYMAALHDLKEYAVLFQTKEPMAHKLHDNQLHLVSSFLGNFVKPQLIPKTAKKLKTFVIDDSVVMKNTDMFMGASTLGIVRNSSHKDHLVDEVLEGLKLGYVKASKVLMNKMPLDNQLLINISAIDPEARGYDATISCLKMLPFQAPQVLTETETDSYLREIYKYQQDDSLPQLTQDTRVDTWWASVQGYPALRKMALAILTCFHGPLVEGVFNLMGDIMDCKSGSMNIETLNAIQTVKSSLKAKGTSAVEFFDRKDVLYTPIVTGLVPLMSGAGSVKNQLLSQQRAEKQSLKENLDIVNKSVMTKKRAFEAVSISVKRSRAAYEEDQC